MTKILFTIAVLCFFQTLSHAQTTYPVDTWKPPVASVAALPTVGNRLGDARVETTAFGIYVWNGLAWVSPGNAGGSGVTNLVAAQPLYASAPSGAVVITLSYTGSLVTQAGVLELSGDTLSSPSGYYYGTGPSSATKGFYALPAAASGASALTVGALDAQAANASGASIVSNILSMQTGDATHPGLVTTAAQTWNGQKTFQGPSGNPVVTIKANQANAALDGLVLMSANSTAWDVNTYNNGDNHFSITQGANFELDLDASGGYAAIGQFNPVSYKWAFADGGSSAGTDPTTIAPGASGQATETLINTSNTAGAPSCRVTQGANTGAQAPDTMMCGIHDTQGSPSTGHQAFYERAGAGWIKVVEFFATTINFFKPVNFEGLIAGNAAAPTGANDLTTKSYVDTQLAQLNPLQAVVAASTANIVGTYTNSVSGICVGDTFQVTSTASFVIDGVTPTLNQRILLKNQTSSFQDGVWTVSTLANVGVLGAMLTRALDFDSSSDINAGSIIPVVGGTQAGSSWFQSGTVATCNTDAQTWTKFQNAASAYLLAANNLSDVSSAAAAFANIAPAPGASGNVMTSNGSAWVSAAGGGGGSSSVNVLVKTTDYTVQSTDGTILTVIAQCTASCKITFPDCTGLSADTSWTVQNGSSNYSPVNIVLGGSNAFDLATLGGGFYYFHNWVSGTGLVMSCNLGETIYGYSF